MADIRRSEQVLDARFGLVLLNLRVGGELLDVRLGALSVTLGQDICGCRQVDVDNAVPICVSDKLDLLRHADRIHQDDCAVRIREPIDDFPKRVAHPSAPRLPVQFFARELQLLPRHGRVTRDLLPEAILGLHPSDLESGNERFRERRFARADASGKHDDEARQAEPPGFIGPPRIAHGWAAAR